MLSLILAALLQAAPGATPAAPVPSLKDNGLPKTDYELVAWCHGALAGQLELDPVAKADMEKIEGKAKVAARAKQDAELEQERRGYLKEYEHALAAAEANSPSYIHQKGVDAEVQGYRLWTATRNKEPIWRMLDWGMWDPNDVGCGDAAKRLYNKSTLFGEALKAKDETKDEAPPPPSPLEAKPTTEKPVIEEKPSSDAKPVEDAKPVATETPPPAPEADKTDEKVEPAKAEAKPVKAAKKKPVKTATAKPSVEKPVAVAETPAPTPAPAPAADSAPVATAEAPKAEEQPAPAALAKKPAKVAAKKPPVKKKLGMDSSAEDIRAAIAAGKAETGAAEPAKDAPAKTDADAPALRGPQS